MALFKITVSKPLRSAGMNIEPGMSIQISTQIPLNPISNFNERERINQLFINNFGVDLKKMGALNISYLKAEKI